MTLEIVRLGDVVERIRNGLSIRQADDAGGLPITRIETISTGSVNGEKVGFAGLQPGDHDEWLLETGDILVSHINSMKHLGKCAIYEGEPQQLIHGMNLLSVRPHPDRAFPKYLFRVLSSPVVRRQIPRIARQSVNQSSFGVRAFGGIKIPLPPLPEQRRIAAILDKADAARRKRQQALDLADQFLRSAFLDLFGDPFTNPEGWPVKKLGGLLVFLTSGSRGWAKYYSDEGAAFLRIQNVGRNRLLLDDLAHVVPPETKEAARTRLQAGDVVLSITADLGRAAVVPESLGPAHVNQHLGLLRVEGIEPLYLAEFLITDAAQLQFRALDTGQTRSGLNFNDLKRLRVPLPPMELQAEFASMHSKSELLRAQYCRLASESEGLARSLTQRAFQGELTAGGMREVRHEG